MKTTFTELGSFDTFSTGGFKPINTEDISNLASSSDIWEENIRRLISNNAFNNDHGDKDYESLLINSIFPFDAHYNTVDSRSGLQYKNISRDRLVNIIADAPSQQTATEYLNQLYLASQGQSAKGLFSPVIANIWKNNDVAAVRSKISQGISDLYQAHGDMFVEELLGKAVNMEYRDNQTIMDKLVFSSNNSSLIDAYKKSQKPDRLVISRFSNQRLLKAFDNERTHIQIRGSSEERENTKDIISILLSTEAGREILIDKAVGEDAGIVDKILSAVRSISGEETAYEELSKLVNRMLSGNENEAESKLLSIYTEAVAEFSRNYISNPTPENISLLEQGIVDAKKVIDNVGLTIYGDWPGSLKIDVGEALLANPQPAKYIFANGLPNDPDSAPTHIDLSALSGLFSRVWQDSTANGLREAGVNFINYQGYLLPMNEKTGQRFGIDMDMELPEEATFVGTLHTHPSEFSDSYTFGEDDLQLMIRKNSEMEFVKSSEAEYLLVKTKATPKSDVDYDMHSRLDHFRKIGYDKLEALEMMVKEFADIYGMAYYKGQSGVFNKVTAD